MESKKPMREEEADEETLLSLIDKRKKNVKRCNEKILYYTAQLKCETSELDKLKAQLEAVQSRKQLAKSVPNSLLKKRKLESSSTSTGSSSMESQSSPGRNETKSEPSKKPQLFIPAMLVPISKPKPAVANLHTATNYGTSHQLGMLKPKPAVASFHTATNHEISHQFGRVKDNEIDMVESVGTSTKVATLNFNSTNLISSQHKRKLRCLELCPTDDTVFATSGLDGAVNLWEVQEKLTSAKFMGSMDCLSPNKRRWPEDIAWHPDGRRMFAVHSADGDDSQVSSFSLRQLGHQKEAFFLEEKAHQKGIINRITFMPWKGQRPCFVTCGCDHAVVLWKEGENEGRWSQELLHRNQHSSSVMAAFGLQHKEAVLSVGADKRVVLFDLAAGRNEIKFQLNSKCLNALPSPCNSNLYLVQLGSPGQQLHLFDIREKPEELHVFGWEQETNESQSALINSSWSPDGWHISSGSNNPLIHIFDIRHSGKRPSQSLKAHSNRVFKAAWHSSLPLLISISSDLHIGMHNYK
ncbi:U5 small nuclear ribonucleoprotein 40 kDa protein [Rhynchospora pubera]|uniref:U5 small nuclear ribonucleoprotein 40 kDa protein n=1 Tax=Rhynchospora pubera TaxID=906938 RepID=A0AAV8BZL0_9POAL|nr:U5 small nuclear ribonucleoprotein 40 kDa protein [Rhynchospora pubera]